MGEILTSAEQVKLGKVRQLDFEPNAELVFPCCGIPLKKEELLPIKQRVAQGLGINAEDLTETALSGLVTQLPSAYERGKLQNPHSFPLATIIPHQCNGKDNPEGIVARVYVRSFGEKQITITSGEQTDYKPESES